MKTTGLTNRKKIRSFFAYLKNCCNFAVLLRAAKMTKKATAFLFDETDYLTSNGCCTFKSVIVALKAEVDSLFNFLKDSFMRATMKNAGKVKHSNHTGTQAERNAAGKRDKITYGTAKIDVMLKTVGSVA